MTRLSEAIEAAKRVLAEYDWCETHDKCGGCIGETDADCGGRRGTAAELRSLLAALEQPVPVGGEGDAGAAQEQLPAGPLRSACEARLAAAELKTLRIAIVRAQAAFARDDLAALATINEDIQGLVDAAIAWARRAQSATTESRPDWAMPGEVTP